MTRAHQLLRDAGPLAGPELGPALDVLSRLDAAELEGSDTAEALLARSLAASERLDHDTTDRLAAQVLEISHEPTRQATALLLRSVAAFGRDRFDDSLRLATEGALLAVGTPLLAAELEAQRGVALRHLGLSARALDAYQKALAQVEDEPTEAAHKLLAIVHNNLATLHSVQHNLPLAIDHLRRGLHLARRLEDTQSLQVQQQINLGLLLLRQDEPDEALEHLETAWAAREGLPEPVRMRVLEGLASARLGRGDLEEALRLSGKVVAFWDARPSSLRRAAARLVLGKTQGRLALPDARATLETAAHLAEEGDHLDVLVEIAETLAELLERQDAWREATHWYRRRLDLERQLLDANRLRAIEELRAQHELERRERENELLRCRTSELEQVVQQRTEELRAQNVELKAARDEAMRANRVKTAFLAMVSHELRTPLNAILGYTALIGESVEDGEPDLEEVREDLDHIDAASQRLLTLIDRVLQLTDLEALEPEEVTVGPVVLSEITAGIASSLGPVAEQEGRALLCEAPDLEVVLGRRHLERALHHLTENALRFADAGRVQVRLVLTDHHTLVAEVADTGMGMDPDLLEILVTAVPSARHVLHAPARRTRTRTRARPAPPPAARLPSAGVLDPRRGDHVPVQGSAALRSKRTRPSSRPSTVVTRTRQ